MCLGQMIVLHFPGSAYAPHTAAGATGVCRAPNCRTGIYIRLKPSSEHAILSMGQYRQI